MSQQPISHQRSLEQERAKVAWKAAESAKGKGAVYADKYGQLVRGAAADIQTNGLGPTLAFWRAKGSGNDTYFINLLADVSSWVKSQVEFSDDQGLLHWIIETATTDEYRRARSEAIAYLGWLKRFAEADLIKK